MKRVLLSRGKNYERILIGLFWNNLNFLVMERNNSGIFVVSDDLIKIEEKREILGTVITVSIVDENEEKSRMVVREAFKECERIKSLYSRFKPDSEVSKLNSRVGEWVKVDPEFYGLIVWGNKFKEDTKGAFDITVKSVLEGWGYDSNYSFQERRGGEIGTIELNSNMQVKVTSEIDLGGYGKGYAIDQMLKKLIDFDNVFIDAEGDVFGKGLNEKGEPWRVFFKHPTNEEEVIGSVFVDNFALACSNARVKKWGKRHHLVNPRTLQPANEMLCVYAQASSAVLADAYSTALFVLGYAEAKKILPRLPVEAMLISPEGRIFKSPGFRGELYIT